jgi:hypothetical protein
MSIFDNLDELRLDPDLTVLAGVREELRHVPVRKPHRQEWVRVHPSPEYQLCCGVYEDKVERETFFVAPAMHGELAGELRPVLLVTAITSQGTVFLWPVPLPGPSGRLIPWHETAGEGCELAKSGWIRLVADMSFGAYRIYVPEGQLPDPVWPDKSFRELLETAFKGRVIDTTEHPVVRWLRGLA